MIKTNPSVEGFLELSFNIWAGPIPKRKERTWEAALEVLDLSLLYDYLFSCKFY